MKYKILIVDDEPANLRMLERLFSNEYEVLTAESGAAGLDHLVRHEVALIVSDQRMPGMSGIEFLQRAAGHRAQTVRFLLTGYTDVDALVEAINSGVVYKYLTKPWTNADLVQSIRRGIEYYESQRSRVLVGQENVRLKERNRGMLRGVVGIAMELLRLKGSTLAEHSRRTASYAAAIGRSLGMETDELERLYTAALLHEVALVRMPPHLLGRDMPLRGEEAAVMRRCLTDGVRLIAEVPGLEEVATTINFQHDYFDGTGSPNGLAGDRIPLHSRILAIADAYDRMRNPSTSLTGFSHEDALLVLQSAAGRLYDPEVVSAFCKLGLGDDGSPTWVGNSEDVAVAARRVTRIGEGQEAPHAASLS